MSYRIHAVKHWPVFAAVGSAQHVLAGSSRLATAKVIRTVYLLASPGDQSQMAEMSNAAETGSVSSRHQSAASVAVRPQ